MFFESGFKTMCRTHSTKRGTRCLGHWCYWCVLAALAVLSAESAYAQTRVDLEVESVHVGPARLSHDEKVEITASVRNNGSQPAEKVFLQADIRQSGKRVKALKGIPVLSNLPRGGVGQSIPINLGELPAGNYETIVMVDPEGLIHETDETNNSRSVRFDVY